MKFKAKRNKVDPSLLEEIKPRGHTMPKVPKKFKRPHKRNSNTDSRGKSTKVIKNEFMPEMRRRLHNMMLNRNYFKKRFYEMRLLEKKAQYRINAIKKYNKDKRQGRVVKTCGAYRFQTN